MLGEPHAADESEGTEGATLESDGRGSKVETREMSAVGAGLWIERAWWLLSGFLLIDWAVRLQGASVPFPFVALAVFLIGGLGLISVVAAATYSPTRPLRRWAISYGWLILVVFLVAYCLFAYVEVHNSPGYGTDEIAFNQYASQLATHWLNPYVRSMAPSFPLYGVSPDGWTYHLNGMPVTNLSYPALSFELYMPFIWAGWMTEVATAVNMIAWGITIVLLFILLPARLRPAALILGTITTFLSYSFGGVTDFLYVPFLIVTFYRWDRFVGERRWSSYVGPVCLGLAMAVKQTPWVIFPFLVIAIGHESWSRYGGRTGLATAGRYAAAALIAFLVPNLPFLYLSPRAWWSGVITPLEGSLVPAGQGPIALTLFLHLGGGSLTAYSAMVAFVLVALLVIFFVTYPSLRSMIAVTPAVVLFFSSRSFGSYLVATLPVLLIAAISPEWAPAKLPASLGGGYDPAAAALRVRFPTWLKRTVLGATVLGLSFIAAFTFSSAPPLRLHVQAVRTTGSLSTIQDITLTATNTTSRSIHPRFTVAENGGAITSFWQVLQGPTLLRPGEQASYLLGARDLTAEVPITAYFAVDAYTQNPNTVSVSNTFLPNHIHVVLTPDAIETPIPPGETVVLHATLRDQFDRRVARAGVPVYLGQIIYDQEGVQNSDAAVDGQAPGTSPVMALTDGQGIATFDIVEGHSGPDPISFQSNLRNGGPNGYPYGYSEIVTILFKG